MAGAAFNSVTGSIGIRVLMQRDKDQFMENRRNLRGINVGRELLASTSSSWESHNESDSPDDAVPKAKLYFRKRRHLNTDMAVNQLNYSLRHSQSSTEETRDLNNLSNNINETQSLDEENLSLEKKIRNTILLGSSSYSDNEDNLSLGIHENSSTVLVENSSAGGNLHSSNRNSRIESDQQSSSGENKDSIRFFFQYLELEARMLSDQKRKVLVNDFQNKLFEMQKGDEH